MRGVPPVAAAAMDEVVEQLVTKAALKAELAARGKRLESSITLTIAEAVVALMLVMAVFIGVGVAIITRLL